MRVKNGRLGHRRAEDFARLRGQRIARRIRVLVRLLEFARVHVQAALGLVIERVHVGRGEQDAAARVVPVMMAAATAAVKLTRYHGFDRRGLLGLVSMVVPLSLLLLLLLLSRRRWHGIVAIHGWARICRIQRVTAYLCSGRGGGRGRSGGLFRSGDICIIIIIIIIIIRRQVRLLIPCATHLNSHVTVFFVCTKYLLKKNR